MISAPWLQFEYGKWLELSSCHLCWFPYIFPRIFALIVYAFFSYQMWRSKNLKTKTKNPSNRCWSKITVCVFCAAGKWYSSKYGTIHAFWTISFVSLFLRSKRFIAMSHEALSYVIRRYTVSCIVKLLSTLTPTLKTSSMSRLIRQTTTETIAHTASYSFVIVCFFIIVPKLKTFKLIQWLSSYHHCRRWLLCVL